MGSCLSASPDSHPDGKTSKSNASVKTSDSSDDLVDNRPVLRQQPRRRSVEGHLAPVPQRDGPVDPRKQTVTATQSQVDFFRILDEKIEQGGDGEADPNSENLEDQSGNVADANESSANVENSTAPAAAEGLGTSENASGYLKSESPQPEEKSSLNSNAALTAEGNSDAQHSADT